MCGREAKSKITSGNEIIANHQMWNANIVWVSCSQWQHKQSEILKEKEKEEAEVGGYKIILWQWAVQLVNNKGNISIWKTISS